MIPVCEPLLDGNEEKYVLDALRSNWISSSGKYLDLLEEKFSCYLGVKYSAACSSGTSALHLACLAAGIGAGDEVIIPNFTLIVSANVVISCGAKPVLVDVDPKTWCINPKLIEEKITKHTKAIMAVHMYGHPCEMDAIMTTAKRHHLFVIEDCAEAHGAEYKGRKVGSIGHAGCFSFYGNKILTSGEGGLVTTSDQKIAEKVKLLRNQAFDKPRFVHHEVGFNYRLTNLQAAIALAQLERVEEKVKRKIEIAKKYSDLLGKKDSALTLPTQTDHCKNVYWMYGVLLGQTYNTKDEVMEELHQNGVETRSFFCPMSRQPVFQKKDNPSFPDVSGKHPISDQLWERGLYLPSGLGLTDAQIKEVSRRLLDCRIPSFSQS